MSKARFCASLEEVMRWVNTRWRVIAASWKLPESALFAYVT